MKNKKTFSISTLGCRTNQYESNAYYRQLTEMGYLPSDGKSAASICIINTCTVTSSADQKSKAKIAQEIKKHPGAKIVVTGCLIENSEEVREELIQFGKKKGASLQVVRNQKKELLIEELFPEETSYPEFKIENFPAKTRAFVKVQDGCNSFCTYCIIPYVRGRSRSRKIVHILKEIRTLIQAGYLEIVLTGINIGDFSDEGKSLSDLVKEVDQIEGLKRLRLSSIDPDEVDAPLKEAILEGKNTCPSMHIVLQSGSNAILKRMNRKYTRQMFFDSVEKLRGDCPDFAFTTDVILGFPGETNEDFLDTLDAVKKARFAKVHMFPFSPRKRTRAALYKDPIAAEEIRRRKSLFLRTAEEVAYQMRSSYLGKTLHVLLEKEEDGWFFGHSEHFLPVFVRGDNLRPNTIVKALAKENTPKGLEAICQ